MLFRTQGDHNMSDRYLDFLKVALGALATLAAVGLGYVFRVLEWRRQETKQETKLEDAQWLSQRRSHWLPLLRAAEEFNGRLKYLRDIYSNQPDLALKPESLSEDFRELYVLSRAWVGNPWTVDANTPRENAHAVAYVRARMCHELTFAQSSVFITVRYLGYAHLVWRDLTENNLEVPRAARETMKQSIANVRDKLQGGSGAGVFAEQQEYIGETVLTAGAVISNVEFRKKLLDLPGWEQYKNLLLFFVEFAPKLEYEVKDTIQALEELEVKLQQWRRCNSRLEYNALWPTDSQGTLTSTAERAAAKAAGAV